MYYLFKEALQAAEEKLCLFYIMWYSCSHDCCCCCCYARNSELRDLIVQLPLTLSRP